MQSDILNGTQINKIIDIWSKWHLVILELFEFLAGIKSETDQEHYF